VGGELQQNRYDQLIRRVGGIIGAGSKVSEALSELFPVIDVERVPIELLFLAGTSLGQGSSLQPGVAANLNHSQLFNPAGSGQLLTLTSVIISTEGSEVVEYTTTETPLTTDVGNVIPRDTRAGLTAPIVGQVRTVTQVAGLPGIGQILIQNAASFVFEPPGGLFVLAPGTGVTFADTVLNRDFRVNYMWRERVATEAELNF